MSFSTSTIFREKSQAAFASVATALPAGSSQEAADTRRTGDKPLFGGSLYIDIDMLWSSKNLWYSLQRYTA